MRNNSTWTPSNSNFHWICVKFRLVLSRPFKSLHLGALQGRSGRPRRRFVAQSVVKETPTSAHYSVCAVGSSWSPPPLYNSARRPQNRHFGIPGSSKIVILERKSIFTKSSQKIVWTKIGIFRPNKCNNLNRRDSIYYIMKILFYNNISIVRVTLSDRSGP